MFEYNTPGFDSGASKNPFDTSGQDEFEAVFGQKPDTRSAEMGDILLPTVSGTGGKQVQASSSVDVEKSGDLHASLERVAKSLGEKR